MFKHKIRLCRKEVPKRQYTSDLAFIASNAKKVHMFFKSPTRARYLLSNHAQTLSFERVVKG